MKTVNEFLDEMLNEERNPMFSLKKHYDYHRKSLAALSEKPSHTLSDKERADLEFHRGALEAAKAKIASHESTPA
jgi:hypothetical protein